jgi:hypothetical protein
VICCGYVDLIMVVEKKITSLIMFELAELCAGEVLSSSPACSEAPTYFLGGSDGIGFCSNEEDWEEWDKGESMVSVWMGLGVSR